MAVHDVQAKLLAARSLRGHAAHLGLVAARRAPSALITDAARRSSGRCWLSQPWHWAKVWVGHHHLDACIRAGLMHQVVTHEQAITTHHAGECKNKSSERSRLRVEFSMPFTHAVLGRACGGGVEDFVEAGSKSDWPVLPKLNRRLVRKRAFGAEPPHTLVALEAKQADMISRARWR